MVIAVVRIWFELEGGVVFVVVGVAHAGSLLAGWPLGSLVDLQGLSWVRVVVLLSTLCFGWGRALIIAVASGADRVAWLI